MRRSPLLTSRSLLWIVGWAGVLFLLLPFLVVIPMSFGAGNTLQFPPEGFSLRWYEHFFASRDWKDPLLLSISIAAWASFIAVLNGTMAAYAIEGFGRVPRAIIAAIFLSPALVPPVVLGVGQFFFFSRLGLVDQSAGIALAHALLSLPLVFFLVSSALNRGARALELQARALGAPRWYAFWRVTLRSLLPVMAASAILSFAQSFDESVLVLFLGTSRTTTLPRRIFDSLRYDLDPTVAAIAGLLVIVWAVLASAAVICFGRRERASNSRTRLGPAELAE